MPDNWARSTLVRIAWGFWWTFLILVVLAASGRNVKFVYIDF